MFLENTAAMQGGVAQADKERLATKYRKALESLK
jgi:hypothetical protein